MRVQNWQGEGQESAASVGEQRKGGRVNKQDAKGVPLVWLVGRKCVADRAGLAHFDAQSSRDHNDRAVGVNSWWQLICVRCVYGGGKESTKLRGCI